MVDALKEDTVNQRSIVSAFRKMGLGTEQQRKVFRDLADLGTVTCHPNPPAVINIAPGTKHDGQAHHAGLERDPERTDG